MATIESRPAINVGDMVYAWTTEDKIAKKAECGGAVTGLLKYALSNKMVDAVLAIKKGRTFMMRSRPSSPIRKNLQTLPDPCIVELSSLQKWPRSSRRAHLAENLL